MRHLTLLWLRQTAQGLLERLQSIKRLESYRFDRLSFSQKFIRFNSETKYMISESIYKSFRDIATCRSWVSELNEKLSILDEKAIPLAQKKADLRKRHNVWYRPGVYRGLDEKLGPDDVLETTYKKEYIGEGIWKYCSNRSTGDALTAVPSFVQIDGGRFYQIVPQSMDIMIYHKSEGTKKDGREESLHLLWAELCRLKIARSLKLRELGNILSNQANEVDKDSYNCIVDTINDFNLMLITASQSYLEAGINMKSKPDLKKEMMRISSLSDHEYACEVFELAGVMSFSLVEEEMNRAIEESQWIVSKIIHRRSCKQQQHLEFCGEGSKHYLKSYAEARIDGDCEWNKENLVFEFLHLKRYLENTVESLSDVDMRYDKLSATQKYIRRNESETRAHLVEQKLVLSEAAGRLRNRITDLRERLKCIDKKK